MWGELQGGGMEWGKHTLNIVHFVLLITQRNSFPKRHFYDHKGKTKGENLEDTKLDVDLGEL